MSYDNDSILISGGKRAKSPKRRIRSIGKKVQVNESANTETIVPNRLDNQMFVPKAKSVADTELYEKGTYSPEDLEAEDKKLEDRFMRGEERYIEQHYKQSASDNNGTSYKIYSYTPEEYEDRVQYFLKKYPSAIRLFSDKYSKAKIYDDLEKYYLTVVPSEQRRSQKSKYAQFALKMSEYTKSFESIKSQIQSAFENDVDEINNYLHHLNLDDPNVLYYDNLRDEEQEEINLMGIQFSLDDIRNAVTSAIAQLKLLIEQVNTFVPDNETYKLTTTEADQLTALKNRIKSFYAFLLSYNYARGAFSDDKAFLHQHRNRFQGANIIDYLKEIFKLGNISGAGRGRKYSQTLSDEDVAILLGFTKDGVPYIKGGALFAPNVKLSKATNETLKKIGDLTITKLYLTQPLNIWEFNHKNKTYYITISKDKGGLEINKASKPSDDEETISLENPKAPITINDIINRTERDIGVDDFHNYHHIHNNNSKLQRQLQKSAIYFLKK